MQASLTPPVLGRKNYLSCGSDAGGQRAACIYTTIETVKLNAINPEAYLADILVRIANYPTRRIDELLPWKSKAEIHAWAAANG
jgi:transposase